MSQSLLTAIPMLGSVGAVVVLAGPNGRGVVTAGIFLTASVIFIAVQVDRQRKNHRQQVSRARASYLSQLRQARAVVRAAAAQQRTALTSRHPPPAALPALAAESSGVWYVEPDDASFLHARVGLAAQRLGIELVPPEALTIHEGDPVATSALRRFLGVHLLQPELPAAIDLRAWSRVAVMGADDEARSLIRALVCSATAAHDPQHLVVGVLASPARLRHWDWVKWLPHAGSTQESDAVGPRRMIGSSPDDLAGLLPDAGPAAPHVLLVLDVDEPPPTAALERPGATLVAVDSSPDHKEQHGLLRLPVDRSADRCDLATARAFARRLAPRATGTQSAGGTLGLMELLELHAPRRLRVPIGVSPDGSAIHLDLNESAQGGMGPHGLLVGATGSGKSELLRTLVLGLAMTHSPEQLNMVLVDFKGGATFAGMSTMPHVSALVTNLAEELTLVDRMQDALSGELVRRQELLRAAGGFASIRDYETARVTGEPLDPLPSLLIVVDEFSEMLAAKPEFLDLFVAIGRLGRSLGLHLLLSSQRLDEGRLRGLESHLSYRVGLRTFSASESRVVLGVPDAYELPAVPGLGFLKPDQSTLLRFRAAYVSGPPARREGGDILPFTSSQVIVADAADAADRSFLDETVARMAGRGAAHQVWLPPLESPDTLAGLLPDLVDDPELGLVSPHWRSLGGLTIPVGTVDRPREQRRDTLTVSLAGAAGHAAVVGGPRSGKSTVLRTMVAALSLCTTPLESRFYVLDYGGGSFTALSGLPHVAGVATRSEPDVVRRVVAEVSAIADRRETEGRAADGYGEVYLVVDGWSALREEQRELELELQALAQRGLTFGVHLLLSATRWGDLRSAMRDVLETRLELRLGDPLDSEIDRKAARQVPQGRPGRGLAPGAFHFLAALPTLGAGEEALVQRCAAAWTGPRGPKLRVLPARITMEQVRGQASSADTADTCLILGINEKELAPVGLSMDREPHLLVLGDRQSGKSTLLRGLVQEIARHRTAKDAQILAVDYRRSLFGEIPTGYQLDHLTGAAQAGPALKELADHLLSRLPGPHVTPEQLRSRSWWSGADVWVLVDDYDLVATQAGSPLAPLVPLLAQARDVGVHLVVTRRSGGAGRAMHEPVIQALRDLATPVLLLSGSPDEGALIGALRPTPQPPGRGRLVTRARGIEVVQLAWTDPAN